MSSKKLSYEDRIKLSRTQKNKSEIPSDIHGSYTGNPLISTQPTQDADDL